MFKSLVELPRFALKAGLGGIEYGVGYAALGAVLLGFADAGLAFYNAEDWYDMSNTWTPTDDKIDYAALKETLKAPNWMKPEWSNLPLAIAVGAVGYGALKFAKGGSKAHH